MADEYIYRGPSDVFRIGEKELARDGRPVELTDKEVKAIKAVEGHRFEKVQSTSKKGGK